MTIYACYDICTDFSRDLLDMLGSASLKAVYELAEAVWNAFVHTGKKKQFIMWINVA